MINESDVDVCDADPGYDVRITVNTTLRTMSRVWRGDIPLSHAQRAGQLDPDRRFHRATGISALAQAVHAGLHPAVNTRRGELTAVPCS